MDREILRDVVPPSGASSASSATYFGVSIEEQTATLLLTFVEIYLALQPTKLTFVEIYLALQSAFLTFFKILVAPFFASAYFVGVTTMRLLKYW